MKQNIRVRLVNLPDANQGLIQGQTFSGHLALYYGDCEAIGRKFIFDHYDTSSASVTIFLHEHGGDVVVEFGFGDDFKSKDSPFTQEQATIIDQFLTAFHGWAGHYTGHHQSEPVPYPLPSEMVAGGAG